jgi:hypothetical protein
MQIADELRGFAVLRAKSDQWIPRAAPSNLEVGAGIAFGKSGVAFADDYVEAGIPRTPTDDLFYTQKGRPYVAGAKAIISELERRGASLTVLEGSRKLLVRWRGTKWLPDEIHEVLVRAERLLVAELIGQPLDCELCGREKAISIAALDIAIGETCLAG